MRTLAKGNSVLGSLFLALSFAVLLFAFPDEGRVSGFLRSSLNRELESEKTILRVPTAEKFGAHLLYLTEDPHQTGTPRNMELAEYVRDRFTEYGLQNVHFHDTPALLSYGKSVLVEIVEPEKTKLKLTEDSFDADKDSYLYRNPRVIPYHEYALSGEVSAGVVYANGGSPEDFAKLRQMGVDVKGKIVIMRYSNPYSYRGYKVYLAEKNGALGAIVYSDPQDDGYVQGEVYPDGPWGPASHVQLGSIIYDWFGYGITPFTFHWKKLPDGSWVEGPTRDKQLPKIPSLPMSHEDASKILAALRGPAVPQEWQGGLPFTYHLGPGPAVVKMKVENTEKIGTMRNVIGMIEGGEEPEKWVVAGNHRDAWVYGAYDPSSGTAALLEVARSLGTAVKQGFRPKRTIVLANWDAEEDLLGGSTSWAKDNREKLLKDGVAYINLDSSASGPDFSGGATPALADFLREAAKAVRHPDIEGSVYDQWASQSPSGMAEVNTIVGATDYTAYQENIGMSCLDLTFDGPYGVYHSQYDDYYWMSHIADPGFRYNVTMSRLLSLIVWRLANVDLLPMRYSDYAAAVDTCFEKIVKKAEENGQKIPLDSARRAAGAWRTASESLEKRLDESIESNPKELQPRLKQINAGLMEVERAMTEQEGLGSRPFFKHLIYAPQPTYRIEFFPRIFEAIEQGKWSAIGRYEEQLVKAFEQARRLIEEIIR